MTQTESKKSPPTSPSGGPVVVPPPHTPPSKIDVESVKKQSKGNGKGKLFTPRKETHNGYSPTEEPVTPTKIALAASLGSPQVLKEGTAENQAWTASLIDAQNFYMDPYATQAWCAPEVDLMPDPSWMSGVPPWPGTGTDALAPSLLEGLDMQNGQTNGLNNGDGFHNGSQAGLRPEAAEFVPGSTPNETMGSAGLRPEAAEFVPPNGAVNGGNIPDNQISVDGLDARKALLTLCGAWGALNGEKANEKSAIKVWEDDGPRMTKAALLKYWAYMKEQDDLDPPEGIGLRTKKRKRR